jgi:undecaprenyl-diphosphatase
MLEEFFKATILGIVEGLTEFIPVSSTGHLIVFGHLLNFEGPRAATFEVFIQLGAILAVVVLYRERFIQLFNFKRSDGFRGISGLKLLALTCIPAFILGFLGRDFIKTSLFSPATVAIGLGVGGIALILVERLLPKSRVTKNGLDTLTWREALVVGLFQCLALWPGMSRSASTIVGGMLSGVERKTATEYSFFAAVPIMVAATGYDLFKSLKHLETGDIPTFGIGLVVAFISALFAIKFFIQLLSKITLAPFGWYRIGAALVIFGLISIGVLK